MADWNPAFAEHWPVECAEVGTAPPSSEHSCRTAGRSASLMCAQREGGHRGPASGRGTGRKPCSVRSFSA